MVANFFVDSILWLFNVVQLPAGRELFLVGPTLDLISYQYKRRRGPGGWPGLRFTSSPETALMLGRALALFRRACGMGQVFLMKLKKTDLLDLTAFYRLMMEA